MKPGKQLKIRILKHFSADCKMFNPRRGGRRRVLDSISQNYNSRILGHSVADQTAKFDYCFYLFAVTHITHRLPVLEIPDLNLFALSNPSL